MDKIEMYNKAIRLKSLGENHKTIADKIGVSRRTVSDWCNGKRDLTKLKGLNNFKVSDEEFIDIVKNNYSVASCIKAQGLEPQGANYQGFKKRIKRLNLNTDHFTGMGYLKGKNHSWGSETPIEEAFVVDGLLSSGNLNKKIRKHNLKPYVCAECGIDQWCGEELSLHLDHINGINDDNRLENLRFLCPNCHSLTKTYCGRNIKKC